MPPPDAAVAYYRSQKRITTAASQHLQALWRRLDPDNIDRSWGRGQIGEEAFVTVSLGQQAAATAADPYLEEVLTEQGIDARPVAAVQERSFAGVAADGRSLETLLYESVIRFKAAIGSGRSIAVAMASGAASIDVIGRTQIADAGRTAVGVAVVARPEVTTWTRMLNPPSCSRCAVLAGKTFRWNQGFARHPLCLPSGVGVSGPSTAAAARRPYQGELVIITTASGQNLPITGNHPVLTRHGWKPAHLLDEGDEVVRSTRPDGAIGIIDDHHQMPALVEDVWRSIGVVGLRFDVSPEDFHGDGCDGEVEVVSADGALAHWEHPALFHQAEKDGLSIRLGLPDGLALEGKAKLLDLGCGSLTCGSVRPGSLGLALAGRHLAGSYDSRRTSVSSLDPCIDESTSNHLARHSVLAAELVLASAHSVCGDDVLDRQRFGLSRWDAPSETFSVESREGYAARGGDLLQRLASQVELDRVVELRRVEWSGHVFSLTSSEGWHVANNLIVSNCDCRHIPTTEHVAGDLTTDPRSYFDSLSAADQDKYFGVDGAQSIRDGADIGQVVNVKRRASGLYQANGQLYTTEGTTKRGVAGKLAPGQARPAPETIYENAGSRADAIEQLRRFGYLN